MNLLSPLNGVFLIIHVAILVVIVYAFVDSLLHTDAAYRAAGKLHKTAWVTILVVAFLFSLAGFLSVIGLIAALIYLLDVRPAVRGISGGSSSQGPYGPW
jgi:di/tricarboxylate transporter